MNLNSLQNPFGKKEKIQVTFGIKKPRSYDRQFNSNDKFSWSNPVEEMVMERAIGMHKNRFFEKRGPRFSHTVRYITSFSTVFNNYFITYLQLTTCLLLPPHRHFTFSVFFLCFSEEGYYITVCLVWILDLQEFVTYKN